MSLSPWYREQSFRKLTEVVGFDVKDFLVDIYYLFDKSTKRQVQLESFCNFCDQDFKKVMKHVSTQWLSLESCVTRTLRLFQALRSYFPLEENPSPHFKKLASKFTNPMAEVYFFYQNVLQSLINFNLFLQWENPLISRLHLQIHFLQVLYKFLKLDVMAGKTPSQCLYRYGLSKNRYWEFVALDISCYL